MGNLLKFIGLPRRTPPPARSKFWYVDERGLNYVSAMTGKATGHYVIGVRGDMLHAVSRDYFEECYVAPIEDGSA
jgi:hypothetical protein